MPSAQGSCKSNQHRTRSYATSQAHVFTQGHACISTRGLQIRGKFTQTDAILFLHWRCTGNWSCSSTVLVVYKYWAGAALELHNYDAGTALELARHQSSTNATPRSADNALRVQCPLQHQRGNAIPMQCQHNRPNPSSDCPLRGEPSGIPCSQLWTRSRATPRSSSPGASKGCHPAVRKVLGDGLLPECEARGATIWFNTIARADTLSPMGDQRQTGSHLQRTLSNRCAFSHRRSRLRF